MIQLKICGVCSPEDAAAAEEAGADLVGFHFCPSVRRVTPEEARAMVQALSGRARPVGVFIDESPQVVDEIASFTGIELAQLHGEEPPGYPARVPIMKALKIRPGVPGPDPAGWPDPILLDAWSEDRRGGTGRTWDWSLADALIARRRVFVAGGLRPGNVGDLVRLHRPHGVDVSSGVESEPRRKDRDLMRAFAEAARRVDGG